MKDFAHACACSLDEAVALLNEPGWRSRVLAGGTDVVVAARAGAVEQCRRVAGGPAGGR
jgi:CO/xanthine dehydrogenase FAD-binding subunit